MNLFTLPDRVLATARIVYLRWRVSVARAKEQALRDQLLKKLAEMDAHAEAKDCDACRQRAAGIRARMEENDRMEVLRT